MFVSYILSLVFPLSLALGPQNVQEFAYKQLKPGVSFEEYDEARQDLAQLVGGQAGVIALTEWRAVYGLGSDMRLQNVTDRNVFVGLYQYESVEAYENVNAVLAASAQLTAFMDTIDVLCFTVQRGTNGTVIDTDSLPYPPAIVEATIADVKPGMMSEFDAAEMSYMNWKAGFAGVGDNMEYIQLKPVYNASVRAMTTVYDDVGALQGLLQALTDSEIPFLTTFTEPCSFFIQRLNIN